MTVTDHPANQFIKAFEVEVYDGHASYVMRVRRDWLDGKKVGDFVHFIAADGTSGFGEFTSVRPIREGL